MKRLKEKRLRTQLFIAASARSSCLLLLLLRSLALIIPDRLRAALQNYKRDAPIRFCLQKMLGTFLITYVLLHLQFDFFTVVAPTLSQEVVSYINIWPNKAEHNTSIAPWSKISQNNV